MAKIFISLDLSLNSGVFFVNSDELFLCMLNDGKLTILLPEANRNADARIDAF